MSISTRGKVGVFFLALSVMAMIALLIVVWSRSRLVGVDVDSSGMDAVYVAHLSGYYLIPIALFGITGVACLIWPSKRPPKLNK